MRDLGHSHGNPPFLFFLCLFPSLLPPSFFPLPLPLPPLSLFTPLSETVSSQVAKLKVEGVLRLWLVVLAAELAWPTGKAQDEMWAAGGAVSQSPSIPSRATARSQKKLGSPHCALLPTQLLQKERLLTFREVGDRTDFLASLRSGEGTWAGFSPKH